MDPNIGIEYNIYVPRHKRVEIDDFGKKRPPRPTPPKRVSKVHKNEGGMVHFDPTGKMIK